MLNASSQEENSASVVGDFSFLMLKKPQSFQKAVPAWKANSLVMPNPNKD